MSVLTQMADAMDELERGTRDFDLLPAAAFIKDLLAALKRKGFSQEEAELIAANADVTLSDYDPTNHDFIRIIDSFAQACKNVRDGAGKLFKNPGLLMNQMKLSLSH